MLNAELSPTRALHLTCTTAPASSQSVIVIDSTYRTIYGSQASQNSSTGTYLTPGRYRNGWAKAVVRYTVKCATQNVTTLDQILTGVAGTSADWETEGSGSHTITAGTTTVVSFTPSAADWRVRIDAGATGPTTCVVHVSVTWNS